jgi:hypothetical protein
VAAEAGEYLEVAPSAERRMEGGALDQRAHLREVRGRVADILAQNLGAAATGTDQAEEHADGGGLAGPVGPDEAGDRASRHVEVQAVDGTDAAVHLGEPGAADGPGGDARRPERGRRSGRRTAAVVDVAMEERCDGCHARWVS